MKNFLAWFKPSTVSGDVTAQSNAVSAQIQAVIIRKDGTREELGVVSYWHRRWYWRILWAMYRPIRDWYRDLNKQPLTGR